MANHSSFDEPKALPPEIQTAIEELAGDSIERVLNKVWSEDRDLAEAASLEVSSHREPAVVTRILEKIVEGREFHFKREAGLAVTNFGLKGLPYLLDALKSGDSMLAKAAGSSLWSVREDARTSAVTAVIELLRDRENRYAAAWALINIHPPAKEANEALTAEFRDPKFRVAAMTALWRINELEWANDPNSFPFQDDPHLRLMPRRSYCA